MKNVTNRNITINVFQNNSWRQTETKTERGRGKIACGREREWVGDWGREGVWEWVNNCACVCVWERERETECLFVILKESQISFFWKKRRLEHICISQTCTTYQQKLDWNKEKNLQLILRVKFVLENYLIDQFIGKSIFIVLRMQLNVITVNI